MPIQPQTDIELVARAEAVYSAVLVDGLLERHRLHLCTTVAALQRFLIDAGTLYLVQKRDQAEHQAPSSLSSELRAIHQLAARLLERLQKFPARVYDFEQSRLQQKLSFGGLGPTTREGISDIDVVYQPGSPEYELAQHLKVICRERNTSAVEGIMVFAQTAMEAINTKDFGGRLPNLALNRWADNVREFWVKGMQLQFSHSVVGTDATSPAANFCIDAMAALDGEPTKANVMTAVRYARDSAIAWQTLTSKPQTETTPDAEG